MTAIPTAVDLTPLEGAGPAIGAPAPTDFGLSEAGAAIGHAAVVGERAALMGLRAQQAQDMRVVLPSLQPAQLAIATHYKEAVANGEATQPDFVAKQLGFARDQYADTISKAGLTASQQALAQTVALKHATVLANQGNDDVSSALAEPIAKNLQARRDNAVADAENVADMVSAPAIKDAKANAPAGTNDVGTQIGQIMDDASAKGLDALTKAFPNDPLAVAQYNARQTVKRSTFMSEGTAAQAQSNQAQVIVGLSRSIDGAVATLGRAPTEDALASAQMRVAGLISNAPIGLQNDLTAESDQKLGLAFFQGLGQDGMWGEGLKLLDSGKYDGMLGDKVSQVRAEMLAGQRAGTPTSAEQYQRQFDATRAADADNQAYLTTGKSAGDLMGQLVQAGVSVEGQGKYRVQREIAGQTYAADGSIDDMTVSQLQAKSTASPPSVLQPDGTPDPQYENKHFTWEAQKTAADNRLAALQKDPAASVLQVKQPNDLASQLQTSYLQWTSPDPATAASGGHDYATGVLGKEYQIGVQPSAMTLIPQSTAHKLVADLNSTPPEMRAAKLQQIAAMMQHMPGSVMLPDHKTVLNTGAMFARQLQAAGLSGTQAAALNYFGDQAGPLGLATTAMTDSSLAKPDPKQKQIVAAVATGMAPWLSQQAHLAGAGSMRQGTLDLATLMTRAEMEKGTNQADAIAHTVAVFQGDTKRVTATWSMPTAAADAKIGGGLLGILPNGADVARAGTVVYQNVLTGHQGALLAGGAERADQVQRAGQWRNSPDGSGLQLYTTQTTGTFAPVKDRYGNDIKASWSELQNYGQTGKVPDAKLAPPPGTPKTASGAYVPGFSSQAGLNALVKGVTSAESSNRPGQVSFAGGPDAPLGPMQVKPSTAAPYAQSLFHAPVDRGRLLNDRHYNQAIGTAVLQNAINYYGASPGGMVLAVADFHSGRGSVNSYISRYGDPRKPGVDPDQWIARVEANNPETGAYIRKVAIRSFQALQEGAPGQPVRGG